MAHKDVFISYTAHDWNWAQWLDYVLRKAGYSTFVQGYDFHVGKSFVAAMDEALRECRLVACLLSPEYLLSPWCKEEWQAGLYANQLFLIRIAECKPDALLGPRAFLDLVGATRNTSRDLVLNALKGPHGANLRPTAEPSFPNDNLAERPRRFPTAFPKIWNISEQRNPYFTGRDKHLHSMHEALSAGSTAALTQAVKGLGGVGKTQLALEYAYRYASEYEAIWWLHAEQPATLAQDYASLAPELAIPELRDQVQLVQEVRKALSHRERFLLVFDNATDPDSIKPYLPQGPFGRVIVTTRAHHWPLSSSQDVNAWSPKSAVAFLLKRTNDTDAATAKELAERLGCLPLALEQAAAYMEICGRSLRDYVRLLEKHGLGLVEKGKPEQYEKTVGSTWSLSFEEIQKRCPPAADLLNLCSFLAPDAIDLRDLATVAHKLPERLAATLKDDLALNDARAALLSFSLVGTEGDMISVHRLVQEVTRNRLESAARDQWQKAALAVVNDIFPQESYDVRTWSTCARWLEHALHVTTLVRSAELSNEDTSRLLGEAGLYLNARAEYAQAEPLMRRALEIAEESYGANHPNVAIHMNNLAQLLQDTNRLSDAEPLMRRALEIAGASYGADHPKVAIRLNNLAQLLQATNRLSEVEPLMQRALEIDEASYGVSHPGVAIDLNNLAFLLQATNRLSEAEPLMRRALEIDEASYGANHPNVARDLNNLGQLLKATNRLSEAEPLMRRALEIDEASYGANHPKVAIRLNNLALLLQATNRLSEAEPLMRRALEIDEVSCGANHPNVARYLNNLGQLLYTTNRLSEAEPLIRRAIEVLKISLGEAHPLVATALNNLGQLLKETNRSSEAEPLIRRALEIDEASYGANHPNVAIRLNNLGQLLQATNRLSEAEPLMRRALDIFEASLGADHPNTAMARRNIESLLAALPRNAQ